jgi:antitoxin HicB
MPKMTKRKLRKRDKKRDIGKELLQAVREMKAGKAARVHYIDVQDAANFSRASAGPKETTRRSREKNPHLGESFDSFLTEEGLNESVKTTAVKRVLAMQLKEAMKHQNLTQAEMARRMKTSRIQLGRLLDPDSDNVTLATLRRAAAIVGREVRLELV